MGLLQFPCEIHALMEQRSPRSTRKSAALRLLKVESGINGLLPTSWGPSIYSVSLLIRLRYALEDDRLLRSSAVRSFLAASSQTQNKGV